MEYLTFSTSWAWKSNSWGPMFTLFSRETWQPWVSLQASITCSQQHGKPDRLATIFTHTGCGTSQCCSCFDVNNDAALLHPNFNMILSALLTLNSRSASFSLESRYSWRSRRAYTWLTFCTCLKLNVISKLMSGRCVCS